MVLNFAEFERIAPARRPMMAPALTANPSGHIALNERFMRLLGDVRDFSFWVKGDGKVVLLKPGADADYHFPKSGSRRDEELCRRLAELKVNLPARYEAKWDEEAFCWIGVLVEEKMVPNVQALSRKYSKKKADGKTVA